MTLNLHKVLYLYKTPSKFYIQPVEQPSEALTIDRQTCEITLNSMFSVGLLPANATSCLIYGIIGIKHLINCPYLIVITKAAQIGLIDGEPIYRMDQAQLIAFNQNSVPLQEGQVDWNSHYVSMLESVLQLPGYYFSYSYDLTNTLQRLSNIQKLKVGKNTSQHHYDERFLWNNHVLSDFHRYGGIADRYKLPLIHGFVSINKVELKYADNWILISRRSIHRAGTRFNSRGIDYDGNVSNFVETEQIIENKSSMRASFVQIRGSIPLFWNQRANYKYKPAIEIELDYDHDQAIRKHFDQLKHHYSNVSVVNLIDKKGHEGNLEQEFSQRMNYLQKYYHIPYHYFDFHKRCSHMRWDRLSILIEEIQKEIESYGYFAKVGDEVIELQSGVVRSNCIDSLDRTNVVQSMIAKTVLELQLQQFRKEMHQPGISYVTQVLSNQYDFMQIFNNAWADNADTLSIQYAGTPALKTDFTRTGQRTQVGLVKDGINSLTRYVSNNFYDNYRQDAIDLFLGNFEGYPSPLYRPLDLTSYTSPLSVTIAVLTLVMLYFYLRY